MTANDTDETRPPQEPTEGVPAGQEGVTVNDSGETPPDSSPEAGKGQNDAEEPETFSREYVQGLRDENAKARIAAKRADTLAQALFHARVTALGKMADPTDLAFDEALLDDGAALEAVVDELIARKPHLAARTFGDVGQGARPTGEQVDLAGMLRQRAG